MRPGAAGRLAGIALLASCHLWSADPAHADALIKRKQTVLQPGADAEAALRARHLAGDAAAFASQDRRALAAHRHTPWLSDWQRRVREVLSPTGRTSRGDNPLAGLELTVLRIHSQAPGVHVVRQRASLDWLACRHAVRSGSPTASPHIELRVLQVTSTGEHLLRLSIGCRVGKLLRRSRLLLQTDSQGVVKSATGLALQLRPAARVGRALPGLCKWPLRPTLLRANFSWLLQAPDRGWIAQVQWQQQASLESTTLNRLPGIVSKRDGKRADRALRATLRFDATGRPTELLLADPVAMMPAEIRAAGQRLDREKVLPPLPRATVTVAVDGVGLWEMPGRVSKEPLWLQLVASASPRQLGVSGWVGAGYVGWRWRAGRIQRIAIPLPRTSAEGLWSCLSLQPKAAIDCRFDPGGLPGARAFSPRLLSLSPAGDLGPLHRRGRE